MVHISEEYDEFYIPINETAYRNMLLYEKVQMGENLLELNIFHEINELDLIFKNSIILIVWIVFGYYLNFIGNIQF